MNSEIATSCHTFKGSILTSKIFENAKIKAIDNPRMMEAR